MKEPVVTIDLKPSFSVEQLVRKVEAAPSQYGLRDRALDVWRLSPAAAALLRADEPSCSALELATRAKNYQLVLRGPRPIDEAISTSGGVAWADLDEALMLKSHPGLFCAGEMIDWDAPTGGYLLQGCFSTATRAANGALAFVQSCASA
jgi:predicted flavoprotein YhiN